MTTEPVFVGCDDGFAHVKMAWKVNGQPIQTLQFPSRIAHGVRFEDMGMGEVDGVYITGGNEFTVLPPLDQEENTRFDDFALSESNRVLVHHGLCKAQLHGQPVRIVTGLPVAKFYRQGSGVNDGLIRKKNENIRLPVASMRGNLQPPRVDQASVMAEGVAAAIDHMLDDHCNERAQLHRAWAVVDIGGRTTDVVTLIRHENGSLGLDSPGTDTENLGAMDAMDELRRSVCVRLDCDKNDVAEWASAFETKRVFFNGVHHEIEDLVKAALTGVGNSILRFVKSKLRSSGKLEKILLVGGGALLFKDLMKEYPHVHIPEHPQFANARGMLKKAMSSTWE